MLPSSGNRSALIPRNDPHTRTHCLFRSLAVIRYQKTKLRSVGKLQAFCQGVGTIMLVELKIRRHLTSERRVAERRRAIVERCQSRSQCLDWVMYSRHCIKPGKAAEQLHLSLAKRPPHNLFQVSPFPGTCAGE